MVMGELDYAGIRSHAEDLESNMTDITLFIFVVFCFTMTLVVNNLLVSCYRKSPTIKGLIPRQRNTSRETVYAKYGWLHMNNSIEFSLREQKIRFASE